VFNTVKEAVKETGADTSIIFVPAKFAADAMMEAIDAGIKLVVTITEGIPVNDVMKAKLFAEERGARIVGPNCPGLITPGQAKVGIMPGHIFKEGSVGVVSRSGTLTYEIVSHLRLFKDDPQTEAVVLIGEIGGTDEQDAADYIAKEFNKPVVAFIAGRTAAIIMGSEGTYEEKRKKFENVGVPVADLPEEVPKLLKDLLKR